MDWMDSNGPYGISHDFTLTIAILYFAIFQGLFLEKASPQVLQVCFYNFGLSLFQPRPTTHEMGFHFWGLGHNSIQSGAFAYKIRGVGLWCGMRKSNQALARF